MSAFRYRAATPQGKIVEGVAQGETRDRVLADLRAKSLLPVEVTEAGPGEASVGGPGGRVGSGARVQFTRSVATLLEAGFPVDRALSVSAEICTDAVLRGVVQAVRQDVRGGHPLTEALAAHPRVFPPVYVAMVAAGERGGALGATFSRLADLQEEAAELRGQVVSALIYPALMLVAGGAAVLLLVFLVVPRFASVLEDAGGTLPWSTRLLLGATDVALRWGWLLALVVAAAAWGAYLWTRTPEGRLARDRLVLRLPAVGGLVHRLATARLARTLGTLLTGGVPLVSALDIARGTTGNEVLSRGLDAASRALREGRSFSGAVDGVLPRLATQMIAVGEESGALPEMLLRVATVYDREVRDALKRAVSLVEPAMILLFGGVVGFVALAMLQAIYGINAGSL